ncbi:unnamed protein product [Parnassius apollo]|uniref:(apollo) hypothetical protein n=1 Tax=Parnassius apollo TaxID=110799 RepID=A0A8S3WQ78_PARAO|nr:unnamed protein product [Parnassius apollo]
MEPIYLNSLNCTEFKNTLDSLDYVFSDCDGVIWSDVPYPGVGEFFHRIKQLGKTVHFVSNNSVRSRKKYEDLFDAADIKYGFENLTIPSIAIAKYLKSIKFNKTVYCMTCPETINTLLAHGIKCKHGPEDGSELYTNYLDYFDDDDEIGAVVFDNDFNVNLAKMYRAITYLRRSEVIYISGALYNYVSLKQGYLSLGPGLFNDVLNKETNRVPIVFGKPGKLLGDYAMKRVGVTDPSRVLFIGDMIKQDVGLGKVAGFKTLLLLPNNTRADMMAHPHLKPDFYTESLSSLVPLLNNVCL